MSDIQAIKDNVKEYKKLVKEKTDKVYKAVETSQQARREQTESPSR